MESHAHPEQSQPPPWEDDPLSTLMASADYNGRVTSLNLADVYRVLQRLHTAFTKVSEAVEKDNQQERLLPRFLIVRGHSSVFAASRLAMSGQAIESYPVLRLGIEQAWYALHIAMDPRPPERARTWLSRNDSPESIRASKQEFHARTVQATHAGLDPETARQMVGLYERTIDFGAHPNQLGLLAGLAKAESGTATTFELPILKVDGISVPAALQTSVAVGVGALKVFRLIYPERFRLVGLDNDIEELVRDLSTTFKPYARRAEQS